MAAVILFNATGYLSLIEKYECPSHKRKYRLFSSALSKEALELVLDTEKYGSTQCPDLFVYSPDLNDWFFCEVKGPGDSLKPKQETYFEELSAVTKKPIRLVRFFELKKD